MNLGLQEMQKKISTNRLYTLLILLLPAIITFFVTLIPTINNQWPISWDVYRHVHLANVYTQYGLVLTDPMINLPEGEKILYPPLFHFLIAGMGTITNMDYFQVVRSLQPVLAMFFVFSVTYIGKKFYGIIAGVSAGFLILSSAMYARLVIAIPENLALIFLPISVYFYYKAAVEKKYVYAIISAILVLFMFSIHRIAPFSPILIIFLFSFFAIIIYDDIKPMYSYLVWISTFIVVSFCLAIVLVMIKPNIVDYVFGKGINILYSIVSYLAYDYNQPLPLWDYKTFLGYMATFFGIIGIVLAILRGARRDLLLLIWVVCMFIFSIAYIFGVNVISFRVLLYILIPLSILGGSSIKFIFDKLSEQKVILPKLLPALFLLFIIGLSTFYGITIAMNPKTVTFGAKTVYGNVSTAPPSDYDMELAQWFEKNGDKTKMAASGNFYTAMFLIATTNQPISRSHEVLTGAKTKSFLISNDIKYLIYDKRLYFSSSDNVPFITADSGQLLYYNKKMKQKPDIPNFAKIVYENKYYIVCQVF